MNTQTIFEKGAPGRRAFVCPQLDVPQVDGLLPDRFRRAEPARLPEVSEPEIVRHYVRLSKRNFDLDSGFYLGLVFGLSYTGGNDSGPIMNRELLIGAIDAWFIPAGLGYAGEQIIGNQDLRHAADKLKSPDMGSDPVRQALRVRCLGIREVAGAQDGNEDLAVVYFTGGTVNDRNRLTTVINKQLLSCMVNLAHGDIDFFCIGAVEVREVAVLIAVRILSFVLVPEKHQCDALPGKVPVDVRPDGKRARVV